MDGKWRRKVVIPDQELAPEEQVAEVGLFLTCDQARALEELAYQHGLTTGQLLRQLIQEFLRQSKEQQNGW